MPKPKPKFTGIALSAKMLMRIKSLMRIVILARVLLDVDLVSDIDAATELVGVADQIAADVKCGVSGLGLARAMCMRGA